MEDVTWPERKSPRLQGFDYAEPRCYFVTICTENRRLLFIHPELNKALVSHLTDHANAHAVVIHAWCLMPNHLHMLMEMPEKGITLSAWVGGFKSRTTLSAWSLGFHGQLWQERFYDHILRKEESIEKVAEYIINNPVRAGLAAAWAEYPWSAIGGQDRM